MLKQRLIQYFFVIAAVTAILEGAFPPDRTMQTIKYALLIVAGLVVGSLIKQDQKDIMIASATYILTILLLDRIINPNQLIKGILLMLKNFAIFVAIVSAIISLEVFSNKATSQKQNLKPLKKTPKKNIKEENKFEDFWARIILIAVGFTFVIIIGEFFFKLNAQLTKIFFIIDLIITTLFIMDLIVLYNKTKTKKEFITKYFFDIISAIPFAGILQTVKIVRAVRIIKELKLLKVTTKTVKLTKAFKVSKTTKLLKINKTTKFLSESNEFNDLIKEPKTRPKKKNQNKKTRTKANKQKIRNKK